jgi:hypothetical protein
MATVQTGRAFPLSRRQESLMSRVLIFGAPDRRAAHDAATRPEKKFNQ